MRLSFFVCEQSFSQLAIRDPITYPHPIELFAWSRLKKRIRDDAHVFGN